MTGILISAAALPVCLTRPPKLILHPPPISKTDIKPIPGISHTNRKTTNKLNRKGFSLHPLVPSTYLSSTLGFRDSVYCIAV
ncbi:hypothetical protein chiPu_0025914 [Chiloscyllium punctatum]|uniref:Uncharacterized protein n=1 Tax=Chiloscyllium punctatum TaxID=137246 RepID=A0A401TGM7_CHIPU|nr:hypothetical protein [Chiloscyllium punctatum]